MTVGHSPSIQENFTKLRKKVFYNYKKIYQTVSHLYPHFCISRIPMNRLLILGKIRGRLFEFTVHLPKIQMRRSSVTLLVSKWSKMSEFSRLSDKSDFLRELRRTPQNGHLEQKFYSVPSCCHRRWLMTTFNHIFKKIMF